MRRYGCADGDRGRAGRRRLLAVALVHAGPSLALLAPANLCHGQCQYEVAHVLSYPITCGIGSVLTIAWARNRHGAVVGVYKCPVSSDYKGFLWTPEDGYTTLQPPPGVVSVEPADINDHGVICGTMIVDPVGNRGFIYDSGVWTQLPPVVPESGWSFAVAISNSGVVVGKRQIGPFYDGQYNAYIWSPSRGFLDLGLMGGPGSFAYGITESGIGPGCSNGGSIPQTVQDCMTCCGSDPLVISECICKVEPCTEGCPPENCE
jgi:hypothetical protein